MLRLRQRQTGPALRHGDRRVDRPGGADGVPGFQGHHRLGRQGARSERQGSGGEVLAQEPRRANGVRRPVQGARAWRGSRSKRTSSTRPSPSSCPPTVQLDLKARLGAEPGDLLLIVADKEDVVCQALGNLRTESGDPAQARRSRRRRTSRSPGCSTSRRSCGTMRRSAGWRTIIRSRRRRTSISTC